MIKCNLEFRLKVQWETLILWLQFMEPCNGGDDDEKV